MRGQSRSFPQVSQTGRVSRILSAEMKIATFNINNVNKRLANLLGWLEAAKPDVV
jgi:hypothetical protein